MSSVSRVVLSGDVDPVPSGPSRSHLSSSCSAMSSMPSNIRRSAAGPKAGIRIRCAFCQLGSSVSAVNRPSPAKSRTCRSGARQHLVEPALVAHLVDELLGADGDDVCGWAARAGRSGRTRRPAPPAPGRPCSASISGRLPTAGWGGGWGMGMLTAVPSRGRAPPSRGRRWRGRRRAAAAAPGRRGAGGRPGRGRRRRRAAGRA